MANFDKAFAFMAPHEWNRLHNYTADPDDPGGATKWGITLNSWKTMGSHADLNEDGEINAEDVQLITEDQAKMFYRAHYWKFDQLNDDVLASKLFDTGVNLGVGTAIIYLQKAINSLGGSVVVDGSLGPMTTSAANGFSTELLPVIVSLQKKHYEDWIAEKPAREKYRDDLIGRAVSLPVA